jgi:hypothetical protein
MASYHELVKRRQEIKDCLNVHEEVQPQSTYNLEIGLNVRNGNVHWDFVLQETVVLPFKL